MPSKSEKQKKFFGAVMGAKKGQEGASGEAKKVAKEMPKKEIKKFLKTEEEDEQSVAKKMKKGGGKFAFEGPKVKERKRFAPATKVEKPKKGKGSYDRKNAFVEDEEDESTDEAKRTRDESRKEVYDSDMPNHKNPWTKRQKNKKPKDEDEENPCWKGYKKKGMKKKGDKTVPNCVKESNEILGFLEALMNKDHAKAHEHIKNAINQKIQKRIADEIENPLF